MINWPVSLHALLNNVIFFLFGHCGITTAKLKNETQIQLIYSGVLT